MKLHDATTVLKTGMEINDDDLLLIEDEEDTKAVKVGDLRDYFIKTSDRQMKDIINQLFDRIINVLGDAKFPTANIIQYKMAVWIGSDSGNIQIALQDIKADRWLTQADLNELVAGNVLTFNPEVRIGKFIRTASSYDIRRFNDEHPAGTNPVLEDADAGFIKAHFDDLKHNDIAGITYDDIFMHLVRTDMSQPNYANLDDTIYEFIQDEESFANPIEYVIETIINPACSGCTVCPLRESEE